jgi:predicted  nucleic acid-binding Zn-ribbon protein
MLAPLKNRRVLERDSADPQADLSLLSAETGESHVARLESEIADLRSALRQSRQAQRKSANTSTRKIVAQLNEISRLNEIVAAQRQRLAEVESARSVEMGRQLQQLGALNDDLGNAMQRVWFLEKTIRAAHAECERLSHERNALAAHFHCPLADGLPG